LKENNSSLLPINTFGLREGYNLSSSNNNNNNLLPKGLDLNVAVLINVLIKMNLTKEYFS